MRFEASWVKIYDPDFGIFHILLTFAVRNEQVKNVEMTLFLQ